MALILPAVVLNLKSSIDMYASNKKDIVFKNHIYNIIVQYGFSVVLGSFAKRVTEKTVGATFTSRQSALFAKVAWV